VQTLTPTLAAALQASHTTAVKVEVLTGTEVIGEIVGPIGGSVTVERAAVERRADVNFFDATSTLTPTELTSLLSPGTGNNLRIWRGVRYPDGTEELVPLITGRIARSSGSWPNLSVSVYDFGWVIARARVEQPYVISAGENVVTAVTNLLADRFGSLQFNFPSTTQTTPLIVLEESADPWDQAYRMTEAIGRRLHFNPLAVPQMADETAPVVDAVWSYQEGPDALIVDLELDLDVEGHYNAVIVTGESPELDVPVRAVAYNTDPSSPTQWGGPFGKVPMFYSSEFITTTAQAQQTANSMLLKELGMEAQIQVTGLVNPAHEVGDLVAIRRLASGVDANYYLDNVTIPLKGATTTMQFRSQRVLESV
jgi:hypothetical protein